MSSDLVPYQPPPGGQSKEPRDALGDYLVHARAWERLPSLVDRDLVRWSAGASLISVALGVVGLMMGSARPPAGFFLVGAVTITAFMRVVLGASSLLIAVGTGGLLASLVASLRPSGMATRVVLAGELVTAGIAVTADAILVAAFVLQLIVWLVIIVLAIVFGVGLLIAILAGAVEG